MLDQSPTRIDINYLKRFPEFQAFRFAQDGTEEQADTLVAANGATTSLTPDEVMRAAGRQL